MDIDLEIQVFDLTNNICNLLKGKKIKGIEIKRVFIHNGNKYKWKDGQNLYFIYGDVTFTSSFLEYFEDTDDYRQKSLIVDTEYAIKNIKGVEKEKLLTFLKAKLRVIKIDKFLKENS